MDTIITIIVTHAVFTILPDSARFCVEIEWRFHNSFVDYNPEQSLTTLSAASRVRLCAFYPDSGRRKKSFEIEIDPPFAIRFRDTIPWYARDYCQIGDSDSIEAFFGALLPCYRDRCMHRYALSVRLIFILRIKKEEKLSITIFTYRDILLWILFRLYNRL